MFSLLANFTATSADLTRTIFSTIASIYHHFPYLLAPLLTYSKTEMTTEQARALLLLVKRDINEVSRQNAAFRLTRVIVARKLVFSELYDFMDELAVMMLQSFSDSTRNQCSRVLLTFTMNYPMSNARIEKLISFVLKNVDYEEPSGRLALLHFIESMIKSFPAEVSGDDELRSSI